MNFLAKDYLETTDGLFVALVVDGLENGKALGFPRYCRSKGTVSKLDPGSVFEFLEENFSKYTHFCDRRDARLAAIPTESIEEYFSATRFSELLLSRQADSLEEKLKQLLSHLQRRGISTKHIGVTGSLLIGLQKPDSDIDLIVRNRDDFFEIKSEFLRLQNRDEDQHEFWRTVFKRRPTSLHFDEYVWHEKRKGTRLNWFGTKVDLSLSSPMVQPEITERFTKVERIVLTCAIEDDSFAFDCPAVWPIKHSAASRVVCWDASYIGQAKKGETVEVSGWLEESNQGMRQVIVGSTRSAQGEYIRVVSGL